jgi:hypothetical protein
MIQSGPKRWRAFAGHQLRQDVPENAELTHVGRRVAEINLKSAEVTSDRRAAESVRMVRALGY